MYSRTARVSTVRWNLKEAVSESLVRRTEIAYKARLRVISWQRTTTLEDALQRPQVRVLQQQGALRFLVLLEGRCAPGRIREIRQLPLL